MATEDVTRWLIERKPAAALEYLGETEDGIQVWDLDFPDGHAFRVGVPTEVVEDAGLLAERLMELESGGWLDEAGEKDLWVLVGRSEVAERPSVW